MEKTIITFSANEQKLQKTGGIDCYASNTVAYIEARFDLGENWSGYDSVRAVWWNDYNKTVATVLDSAGTCIVPYEVLTRKGAVKVNLVGSIADGDVLTDRLTTCPVVALTIKCNAKTDGDNTQPITPSEYEQFVQTVKADADRAEAGAESAEASAQSASESATASANSATSSAQSATASAQSEQNASESAQSAENAKDDAEDARDKILGMRATATTLEAGSDATASYDNGLLTLGIPRGDKGAKGDTGDTGATPNISIGTVETLEPTEDATASITGTTENPVLNLGLPKGDTGEVSLEQLSALLPTDTASGAIASFPDGTDLFPALSVKAQIEPIQDLHGYDKPWVGGAGKNKLHATLTDAKANNVTAAGWTWNGNVATKSGVSFTVQTDDNDNVLSITVNGTNTGTANLYFTLYDNTNSAGAFNGMILNGCPSGGGYNSYGLLLTNISTRAVYDHGSGVTIDNDDSGKVRVQIVVISNYTANNLVFRPMLRLASEADATFAPYSNICPISGHTECDTYVSGKNLCEGVYPQLISLADGGARVEVLRGTGTCLITHVVEGQTYVFSNASINRRLVSYWDSLPSVGDKTDTYDNLGSVNHFTALKTGLALVYIYNSATDTSTAQIELGTTATDYEPYQGTSYTTDLGRTVYGGTLDVVSGELVVDRAMVDMGTLNWRYNGVVPNGYQYAVAIADKAVGETNFICSSYATGSPQTTLGYICGRASTTTVACNALESTQNDFIASVSGQTLVYELATPQTIQLTPQEVQLLLGTNNIWSDGKVTLTYNADIQKWVEKKLNGNSTTLTMSRPMTEETE